MRWKKIANDFYKAEGKDGTFRIIRLRGRWRAEYIPSDEARRIFGIKDFAFFGNGIRDLKARCEDNYYWEGAV